MLLIDNPNVHGQYYSTKYARKTEAQPLPYYKPWRSTYKKPELYSNPMPIPSHPRDKEHTGGLIVQIDTTSIREKSSLALVALPPTTSPQNDDRRFCFQ
jgi:hypothetical protein